MSSTVPAQHPAVVLRSSYEHLRGLLVIAVVTILSLTVAVTVLAIDTGSGTTMHLSAGRAAVAPQANTVERVVPNPDQFGPQPSPSYTGPVVSYPGHF